MRMLLVVLALFGAGAALTIASPAKAQEQNACTTEERGVERTRTRHYRVTTQIADFRNICSYPIKFYYCFSPATTPCTNAAQYLVRNLVPGQETRVHNDTGVSAYLHVKQCRANEQLVNERSIITGATWLECSSSTGAPVVDTSAAFTGMGDTPDFALPEVKMRPGPPPIGLNDYPADMVRIGAEGRTTVALAVNEAGRATGCKVIRSSGFGSFDRATCRALMLRGRFFPAIDAAGNPVRGVYKEFNMAWAKGG
ncbi:energy transducer TonB [Sphingomonas soli]|uniref:energy transducer TonB n=1 Tax=Sphingomonas soli TaxID=266127 RepID=UPI000A731149|nr:energy transducer TonB [Sphingomonas soli]